MSSDELATKLRSGRTALFLGAGISRQAGIPLAQEIERGILRTVDIEDADARQYLDKKLPFEATMQAASAQGGGHILFDVFSGTAPQRNHHFFAGLAISRIVPVILTTNFDTLLEQAARVAGEHLETVLDDTNVSTLASAPARPLLVKLHGCITRPAALGATIRAVAHERGVQSRRAALQFFLGGGYVEDVVVFGYSFSDRFDITPALRSLHFPVKFWVIDHGSELTMSSAPLGDLPAGHPLRNCDGAVIRVHTDHLIETLWKCLRPDPPCPLVYDTVRLTDILLKWRAELDRTEGPAAVPLAAALLLKAAGCYAPSNTHAALALAKIDSTIRPAQTATAYQTTGDNFRDLHASADALRYLRAALVAAHRAGSFESKAKALNSIGILFEDQAKGMDQIAEASEPHEPRKLAIRYYEQALKWASAAGDTEMEAKCTSNIGIAMKNVVSASYRRMAYRRIRDALTTARQLGDQKSAARCYGMMASCLSLLGKKRTGILLLRRALEISGDMGDALHVAIWTANMGEDYIGLDASMAKKCLTEAVTMFSGLGIATHVNYCQKLLARISPGLS